MIFGEIEFSDGLLKQVDVGEKFSLFGKTDIEDFRKTIEHRIAEETSAEAKNFLRGVLENPDPGGKDIFACLESDSTTLCNAFIGLSRDRKILFLSGLSQTRKERIRPVLPKLFLLERNLSVCRCMIQVFPEFWAPEMQSDAQNLTLAESRAFRTFLQEGFYQGFPELFLSKIPRTGASSSQGWHEKWEIEEHLPQLQSTLLTGDMESRLIALEKCYFLPFPKIRPMIFSFLAAEKNLALISIAARLLEANPDSDIPFNLYEIVEESQGQKAALGKRIISHCCNLLEKSQMGGESYKDFIQRLQAWISKRAAVKFVRQCIEHFKVSKAPLEEYGEAISKRIEKAFIREAFQDAMTWGLEDNINRCIAQLLGLEVAPLKEDATMEESLDNFYQLKEVTKVRTLAASEERHREIVAELVDEILVNKKSSPRLLGTAIRTALRLRVPGLSQKLVNVLRMSDPNPVTAAIEYCGEFDLDRIIPFLGKYLNDPNSQIKVAALRVLKKADLGQALSSLRSLLENNQPAQRTLALSCMFHFDFRLVRDLLTEFLTDLRDEKLFQSALFLFKANPEPENLPILKKLQKNAPGSTKSEVEEILVNTRKTLVDMGVLPGPDLDSEQPLAHVEEPSDSDRGQVSDPSPEKTNPPPVVPPTPPPRTIESLVDLIEEPKKKKKKEKLSKGEELKNTLFGFGKNFWLSTAAVFGVVLIVMIVGYSQQEEGWGEKSEGQAIAGSPITVYGTIETVDTDSDEIALKSKVGKYYVLPIPVNSRVPAKGDYVKVILLPYLLDKNGHTRARVISFQTQ